MVGKLKLENVSEEEVNDIVKKAEEREYATLVHRKNTLETTNIWEVQGDILMIEVRLHVSVI